MAIAMPYIEIEGPNTATEKIVTKPPMAMLYHHGDRKRMAKSEFSRILIFMLVRLAVRAASGLLAKGPGFDQMMCDRNCARNC